MVEIEKSSPRSAQVTGRPRPRSFAAAQTIPRRGEDPRSARRRRWRARLLGSVPREVISCRRAKSTQLAASRKAGPLCAKARRSILLLLRLRS